MQRAREVAHSKHVTNVCNNDDDNDDNDNDSCDDDDDSDNHICHLNKLALYICFFLETMERGNETFIIKHCYLNNFFHLIHSAYFY